MPDNISPYVKTRAGWIATWLVKNVSSGDDDECQAVKEAEAGTTHFVTFITASTDFRESEINTEDGGAVKVQLKDDSTVVWEAWITGDQLGHFVFPAPIQMGEGNEISVVTDMTLVKGDDSQASVTFGGFSDDNRSN